MTWANRRPPSDIPRPTQRLIRARQHNRCNTYDPTVCTGRIDQFDHIINIATLGVPRHHANQPDNLQGLCRPCHNKKTATESAAAKRRHLRTPPRHPSDA